MMSISDICKDAVGYPFRNAKLLGVLAVIFIISALLELLVTSSSILRTISYLSPGYSSSVYWGWMGSQPLEIIASIIGIIIFLAILGYKYRLMASSINSKGDFPQFTNIKLLFKQGVKMALATVVYLIIPAILLSVSVALMGPRFDLFVNEIGSALLLVAIVVFIIAVCLLELAFANMVKYNTFKYAFKIKEIFNVVKSVGYLRIIGAVVFAWILIGLLSLAVFIVAMFCSFALLGITDMLMISIIAFVVFNALMSTYDIVFYSRFYSLIYKEGKGIK